MLKVRIGIGERARAQSGCVGVLQKLIDGQDRMSSVWIDAGEHNQTVSREGFDDFAKPLSVETIVSYGKLLSSCRSTANKPSDTTVVFRVVFKTIPA